MRWKGKGKNEGKKKPGEMAWSDVLKLSFWVGQVRLLASADRIPPTPHAINEVTKSNACNKEQFIAKGNPTTIYGSHPTTQNG